MRSERIGTNLIYWIAACILILSFTGCSSKKKKSPAADLAWSQNQDGKPESSGLVWVGKYCERVKECASKDLKEVDADTSAIVEKALKKEVCIEEFKESKIYFLEFPDPKAAFGRAVSCLQTAVSADCSAFQKGIQNLSEDCKWMYSAQNSK